MTKIARAIIAVLTVQLILVTLYAVYVHNSASTAVQIGMYHSCLHIGAPAVAMLRDRDTATTTEDVWRQLHDDCSSNHEKIPTVGKDAEQTKAHILPTVEALMTRHP